MKLHKIIEKENRIKKNNKIVFIKNHWNWIKKKINELHEITIYLKFQKLF